MALTVDVLGRVVATMDGTVIELPRARERAVLTALALAYPAAVPADWLVEVLWGEAGGGSVQTVRSYVSRLRHVLGPQHLVSGPDGYRLDVPAAALDVNRAQGLLAHAVAAGQVGDHETAQAAAQAALSLWRGTPYAELSTVSADIARTQLAGLLSEGVAALAKALLGLGRPVRAAEVLAPACADAPFDETLWALWVRALAAAGRRDEAMSRFDDVRSALSRELGIDPGEALQRARAEVLTGSATALRRMPVRYAEHDGRSLCHAVLGRAGPPLLFLHGLFMPSEMLIEEPSAAAFLKQLAARHRVVVMDLGGLGLSDPVPPPQLGFEGWADDAAAVLDHLRVHVSPVIACGPSTAVAMHLAARRPDLVPRLVLAGVPLRSAWGEEQLDEVIDNIDGRPGASDAVSYLAPSRTGDAAFTDWLDRGGERGASPAVARAFFRMLFAADLTDLVARTAVPTLVIDRPDAPGNGLHTAEVLALLPDGHHVVQPGIPDVLPFLGEPEGWVDAALAFLGGKLANGRPQRLAAVAATRSVAGDVAVTAHATPADADRAARARLTAGGGAAVLHAGLVSSLTPPVGPAVDRARQHLTKVSDGIVPTAAFATLADS
ncbi:MAG TPA: alpha/beta fold hydrolase [Egibacteraceae bacterium]|nr:alpha/beta fold hydrolase [Egibacteraceae bacterium]